MKRVTLHHAGLTEAVEVVLQRAHAADSNLWSITIGDQTLEVDVRSDANSTSSGVLRLHNRVLPYRALRRDRTLQLWLAGRTYRFELPDARRRSGEAPGSAALGSLNAPMPGTVLALRVKEGDAFAAHDPLVILESMKMEMTLSAPAPGKVRAVRCAEGELVDMGAVLLELTGADEWTGDDDGNEIS